MKKTVGLRSLLIMFVMAFMLTAVAPVAAPQSHTAMAAKKKSSKKKSSKKKSSKKKKSAKVNLKINKGLVTVKVGKSAALKVSGNAKKAVKWSSTSKCVKLSKKSGTKIKVKGVKEGVAAVIANVGSAKVVCAVYVGKGTYADASSKTKKALGNPIRLLAAYVASHPIVISSGDTSTSKDSTDIYTYTLSVSGNNLVVGVVNQWSGSGDDDDDQPYTYNNSSSNTMAIPLDGNPVATITYSYNSSKSTGYNNSSTRTASININTVTPATEFSWSGYTYTEPVYNSLIGDLINILHCMLVDNNTGFSARDIGFYAYPASHRDIGLLTSSDLAAFATQMAQMKAYYQAH